MKDKIVLWDIETSAMTVETFDLYPESIPFQNIIEDWHIICGSWKELDGKKVYSVDKTGDPKRFKKDPRDDYYVVKTLRDMLEDVRLLIHHNGVKFDIKKLNARIIHHGLPPLPNIPSVDTLSEVKKIAKFSSHKLDYLTQSSGIGQKLHTSPGLWRAAAAGEPKAIKEMVSYNRIDVILLENWYKKLQPYIRKHPVLSWLVGTCLLPGCGGQLIRRGPDVSKGGIPYQRFSCKKCGGWSRERLPMKEFERPQIVTV